jgi:hypothetical protein
VDAASTGFSVTRGFEECADTDHLFVFKWFASCAWVRRDAPCSCLRQARSLRFGVVHALPMNDSKLEDALQHVIHSIIQLQNTSSSRSAPCGVVHALPVKTPQGQQRGSLGMNTDARSTVLNPSEWPLLLSRGICDLPMSLWGCAWCSGAERGL